MKISIKHMEISRIMFNTYSINLKMKNLLALSFNVLSLLNVCAGYKHIGLNLDL